MKPSDPENSALPAVRSSNLDVASSLHDVSTDSDLERRSGRLRLPDTDASCGYLLGLDLFEAQDQIMFGT